MNLEQRLRTKGSTLTQSDGRNIPGYDGVSKLDPINLYNSNLDLNGIEPVSYDRQTKQTKAGLAKSTLDLDGQTPKNNYRIPQYILTLLLKKL